MSEVPRPPRSCPRIGAAHLSSRLSAAAACSRWRSDREGSTRIRNSSVGTGARWRWIARASVTMQSIEGGLRHAHPGRPARNKTRVAPARPATMAWFDPCLPASTTFTWASTVSPHRPPAAPHQERSTVALPMTTICRREPLSTPPSAERSGASVVTRLLALVSHPPPARLAPDEPASSAVPGPSRAPSPAAAGCRRCRHGVVGLEPEALAVLGRRELVRDRQVAFEHLLGLAADQATRWSGQINGARAPPARPSPLPGVRP